MGANRTSEDTGQGGALWGRIISGAAIISAIGGFALAFLSAGASVVPGAVGIGLGALGYFLGARRLGVIAVILCTISLFFGVAVGQGLIPGTEPYRERQDIPSEGPLSE